MCIEDVRLGRRSGTRVSTVTLPAAGTVTNIVPAQPYRTHLYIAQANRERCNVAPEGITPSATIGIALGSTSTVGVDVSDILSQPIEFDIKDHGLVVTHPWSGAATGGVDCTLTIIETFLEEL